MTVISHAPSAEEVPTNTLSQLCTADDVSLLSCINEDVETLGSGHITVSITSQAFLPQQAIIVRFYMADDTEELISIVLTSTSKGWLEQNHVIAFPRSDGGLWKLDFTETERSNMDTFQDILTYFIKYENRHHMHNTLAFIDPASCQVTQVVAHDVHLDGEVTEHISKDTSDLDEDDFMRTEDDKVGQKLPVMVNGDDRTASDPSSIRKVQLLNQSSNALVQGSDRIANSLVFSAQVLARNIQNGTRNLEAQIQPSSSPMRLSVEEREMLDRVHNVTSSMRQATSNFLDKAISATISGIRALREDEPRSEQQQDPVMDASRNFGSSALQSAAKVVGGVVTAAGAVLGSSRDSLIQIIQKKYGDDARYLAEKTLGSTSNMVDMLVYFDARGISRRVVVNGVQKFGQAKNTINSQGTATAGYPRQVVFENTGLSESDGASIAGLQDKKSQDQDDEETPHLPPRPKA